MAKKVTGQASAEQIKKWKEALGVKELDTIIVDVSDNEQSIGYLKKPNRDIKAKAMSMFAQQELIETGNLIIQNCWLGGDQRMKDLNSEINEAACISANTLVKFYTSEVGKV